VSPSRRRLFVVTASGLPFAVSDLTLTFHSSNYLGSMAEPEHRFTEHWSVTAGPLDSNGEIAEQVGSVAIVVVNVGAALAAGQPPTELLDEWSQDLVDIGEAIFDRDGEYSEELRDWLGGVLLIGDLLVLDRISIDPRFRGHGLGPLIAGLAIASLGRGCGLAACIPAPIEGDLEGLARDRAVKALQRAWASVGFQHYQDNVWVLDMESQPYEDMISGLLKRI
jgi:GNAT superfamily N-acetyltransferase